MLNTRVFVPILLVFCSVLVSGLKAQETPYQWKEEAERKAKEAEKALAEIQRLCGLNPKNARAIEDQVNIAEKATKDAQKAQAKVGNSKDFKEDAAKAAKKAEDAWKAVKNTASGIAKRRAICNFTSEESARIDGEQELCKGQKATAKNVLKGICEKAEEASRINPCDSTAVNDSIDTYVKRVLNDSTVCDVYKDWLKNLLEISKTGKDYRVPVALASIQPEKRNVWLTATAGFPMASPEDMTVSSRQLMEAVQQPQVFEALYQTFEGAVFLGQVAGSRVQDVVMSGHTNVMPGMHAGVRVGRPFELNVAVQQYSTNWSGTFGFTVISHNQPGQQTGQGSVQAEQSGVLATAGASWYAGMNHFRPFVRAGIQADIPLENTIQGALGGVALDLGQPEKGDVGLAPFGAVGMRMVVWNRVALEVSCSYGKLNGVYVPSAGLGLGVGF